MTEKSIPSENKQGKVQPPQKKAPDKHPAEGPAPDRPLADLQHQVGNRAVQRLIAQRQAGPAETDEATTDEINQMRGSGQSLDGNVQREMGTKMGADFSGVNVHTSPQADNLNQRLGARAFTTGQDIFFRQGEYSPGSEGGKELLAHELTHVVQQRQGADQEPAAKMVVNPPDDIYERQADQVAKQVTGPATVQTQPEEEELVQGKRLQRQEEEEELMQGKFLQRQEEEEELAMPKLIQREEMPREEELQAKLLQRQEMPEEEEELQMAADTEKEEELEEQA